MQQRGCWLASPADLHFSSWVPYPYTFPCNSEGAGLLLQQIFNFPARYYTRTLFHATARVLTCLLSRFAIFWLTGISRLIAQTAPLDKNRLKIHSLLKKAESALATQVRTGMIGLADFFTNAESKALAPRPAPVAGTDKPWSMSSCSADLSAAERPCFTKQALAATKNSLNHRNHWSRWPPGLWHRAYWLSSLSLYSFCINSSLALFPFSLWALLF